MNFSIIGFYILCAFGERVWHVLIVLSLTVIITLYGVITIVIIHRVFCLSKLYKKKKKNVRLVNRSMTFFFF